jgi:hypothetical protein
LTGSWHLTLTHVIDVFFCLSFNADFNVDKEWTVEIAIPVKEMERPGAKVAPGSQWRIDLGRYNYSVYLDNKELSTTGYPSTGSFHDISMWNRLVFVK